MADHLLVPMQLDALVVTNDVVDSTSFTPFEMTYDQAAFFGPLEPDPFAPEQPPPCGVHLHWTLPAPLRAAGDAGSLDPDTTAGAGSTPYPLIPNRWMIARLPTDQSTPSARAWLVESDRIDPAAGGAAYYLQDSGTATSTRIGRSFDFPLTAAPDPPGTPFLRAVGPGNATFTTFAPGVQDVLAFHDDLGDLPTPPIGSNPTYTYVVVGWYADPGSDPLGATTWSTDPADPTSSTNDAFGWRVSTAGTPPSNLLLHAFVTPVAPFVDPQPAERFPDDIPGTVRVALGNNAIEALAAIVAADRGQAEADMLVAFQYGLLDTYDRPGSTELLDMKRRRHWYGSSPGGVRWTIAPGPHGSAAPSAAQLEQLAALNGLQLEQDRQRRLVDSMGWDLYALWWKANRWTNLPPDIPDTNLTTFLAAQLALVDADSSTSPYVSAVTSAQAAVAALAGDVDQAATALSGELQAIDATLRAVPRPGYAIRSDPVLLITGLGRASNLDQASVGWCRTEAQTVATITVDGTPYVASDLPMPTIDDAYGVLPSPATSILAETILLTTDVLVVSGADATAVTAAIQALPVAPASPDDAFLPDPVSMAVWSQPWIPLLLDWEVYVFDGPAYPAPTGGQDYPAPALDTTAWAFDGTNYSWPTTALYDANHAPVFRETTAARLQGRTFITPFLASALADRLDTYIAQHSATDPTAAELLADLDQYTQSLSAVDSMDVLSQRLSGLLAMLVQRDLRATVAPPAALTPTLHGTPLPSSEQPYAFDFAPMCGTFFVINRLSVIDSFGRAADVVLANHNPATTGTTTAGESFFPLASPLLMASTTLTEPPANDPGAGARDPQLRMLQLTPGPIQDAKVELTLLTNDGQDRDIDLVAGSTPVCGWLVPNHLDRSVTVYAPDGTCWGELRATEQIGGAYAPSWMPAPTDPNAPAQVGDIPNKYISSMLGALCSRSDAGAALNDLLTIIDAALWTINPQSRHQDEDTAVLVGRPLAVVRTTVTLRLRGLAYARQDWWNTFDIDPTNPPAAASTSIGVGRVDGGVSAQAWPIRLGSQVLRDDGLVGYFVDEPANGFDLLHVVSRPATATSTYTAQIGPGAYPTVTWTDDTVSTPDPAAGQALVLTMLVDPRASVHAFTGLAPVASVHLPPSYVKPALDAMSYMFRAGPVLTASDGIRLPRPATHRGAWTWFDHTAGTAIPVAAADGGTRLATPPPTIKEGWLLYTRHQQAATPPREAPEVHP